MESTTDGVSLRLTGGGAFFDGSFSYSASWPFVVLIANESGISIGWRWTRASENRPCFEWADLHELQLSRSTVSWYDHEMFLYRFVSPADDPLEGLRALLDQHDVAYKVVRRTWTRALTLT